MQKFQFVKITRYPDGSYVEQPVWCLGIRFNGDTVTACSHTMYGEHQGRVFSPTGFVPIEYKVKEGVRGITCEECKQVVRYFKSVKL